MKVHEIARVCHEANRAYCEALGDHSQKAWEVSPEWQRESAVNGVRFHLDNPKAGPDQSHVNWMQGKILEGWVYGEVKDPEAKTHPCMLPYGELPIAQRAKDFIFRHLVHTLATVHTYADLQGIKDDELLAELSGDTCNQS